MLHKQADAGDRDPAAETHKYRLSAGFDQLYYICVEPYRRHSHYDKELGQRLKRGEYVRRYAERGRYRGYDRGYNKKYYKEREYLLDRKVISRRALLFSRPVYSQNKSYRYYRKRARKLDYGRAVQCVRARVHTVPRRSRRRDRRRVVYRRAREESEPLVAHSYKRAEGGEYKRG